MSGYEPGTVAVATVRGVEGVRVMAGYGTAEPRLRWLTTDSRLVDEHNDGWYFAFDVTDVRPLVVLDLDEYSADELASWLDGTDAHMSIGDRLRVAREIRGQFKPARIPEPGLWGVVAATMPSRVKPCTLVRHSVDEAALNWLSPSGDWFAWHHLIDPVLVREGVES